MAVKQLVGMMILVYVKDEAMAYISDVSTEAVGTGLLGMVVCNENHSIF